MRVKNCRQQARFDPGPVVTDGNLIRTRRNQNVLAARLRGIQKQVDKNAFPSGGVTGKPETWFNVSLKSNIGTIYRLEIIADELYGGSGHPFEFGARALLFNDTVSNSL